MKRSISCLSTGVAKLQTLLGTLWLASFLVSPAVEAATNTFSISSPANNAKVSGTIQIKGAAGAKWLNIAAYDSSGNKVASDVTPASGAFSLSMNTLSLPNGTNLISVVAFSVAAGQPGGTSKALQRTFIVNNVSPTPTPAPTATPVGATAFTISSPANNAKASGTISVSGIAGSQWVNIAAYDASGNKLATDVAPANGKYSLSVNTSSLANGSNTISIMAFSVAAGQSGGTSTALSLTLNVSNTVTATPTPSPTPTSTVSPFYGVNAHYVQGGVYSTNVAQQVADMKAMGIGVVRQDCYSTADMATMASLVSSFAPIKIQPVFNVFPSKTATEAASYSQFYAYGQTVANQLAGKVAVIEMMNEPENMYFSNGSSGNGQNVTDWSTSQSEWPAFRGSIRGFYEGFRSIDTAKKTLIASPSVGWLHYGILTGLWNGQGADGSTGNATARWDITNYHWYYDFDDILNAGNTNTNVLAVLKASFNLPITMSEIGVQTSVTSAVYNSYVNSAISQYAGLASTYNIIGVSWYELYNFQNLNGFYMGLYSSQGVANAGRAAAMTSAILANPK